MLDLQIEFGELLLQLPVLALERLLADRGTGLQGAFPGLVDPALDDAGGDLMLARRGAGRHPPQFDLGHELFLETDFKLPTLFTHDRLLLWRGYTTRRLSRSPPAQVFRMGLQLMGRSPVPCKVDVHTKANMCLI